MKFSQIAGNVEAAFPAVNLLHKPQCNYLTVASLDHFTWIVINGLGKLSESDCQQLGANFRER